MRLMLSLSLSHKMDSIICLHCLNWLRLVYLMGLIYCPPDGSGKGVFEVVFRAGLDEDSAELARNVSPFTVEPGKFTYRLVRGALEMTNYGPIFAHCRIGLGTWLIVPLTLLPPKQ
jgi:hypothetical protein